MHVSTVQKLPLSTVGAPLQIRCKTFLSVTFVLPRERECHDLYTSLMQMSQPCKIHPRRLDGETGQRNDPIFTLFFPVQST